jgi:hypothetical protein
MAAPATFAETAYGVICTVGDTRNTDNCLVTAP